MMIKLKLQEIIANNRRSAPLRLAAKCSEMYLRAWYNEARWDFRNNGEAFVLSRFNQWARGREVAIWDVGAHYGEWSEAAHKLVPSASVHSFEIIQETALRLTDTEWRSVHAFGLSDTEGVVDVHWNKGNDTESSINPRTDYPSYQGVPVAVIQSKVKTGDQLVDELDTPDFVKIDVEGHEAFVLRGFRETLQGADAPWLIQFEYGATYVPSGSTLREIYALLPNYSIGRLYPGYVDFKPYSYSDEHLRMGNMIATRDRALQNLLAG
jgi:FkbM family methyltransferase